jgi:hypothetical protein
MQVSKMADVVNYKRAAGTALIPAWIKHEVVDDQLATLVEEIEQTHFAVWTLEEVLLVDLDHRQLATFSIDLVSRAGGFLFLDEQPIASNDPLVA